MEYLFDLKPYSKHFLLASMDIELEKENKRVELQNRLLKDSDGVMPVFAVQL